MAPEAINTVIDIAVYIIVLIICIIFQVAEQTREDGVIVGYGMAIRTSIPLSLVGPTKDGEVLPVVIKG